MEAKILGDVQVMEEQLDLVVVDKVDEKEQEQLRS